MRWVQWIGWPAPAASIGVRCSLCGTEAEQLVSLERSQSSYRLATTMAAKADEYRVKASECELRAGQVVDPETRWQFRDMARQWREMAERRDRVSAEREGRPAPRG
jgi:hypothetical protein